MSAIWNNRKQKGFEVILAAVNMNPEVPDFIRKYNVPFPVGTANEVQARYFMQISTMQRAIVPWLTIIDRKGIIRERRYGDDPFMFDSQQMTNIAKVVDQLLAEPAGPPAAKKSVTKKK